MTAPDSEIVATVPSKVQTRVDYAVIGAQLGAIGLDAQDINAILGMLERTALQESKEAAQRTAMALLPVIGTAVQNAWVAAATEIYNRIIRKGTMGILAHQRCADIALQVARQRPVQAVQQYIPVDRQSLAQ